MNAIETRNKVIESRKAGDVNRAIFLVMYGREAQAGSLEYQAFLRRAEEVNRLGLDLTIPLNPANAPIPSDAFARTYLALSLGMTPDRNTFADVLAYFGRIGFKYQILFVREAILEPGIGSSREYVAWCVAHQDAILGPEDVVGKLEKPNPDQGGKVFASLDEPE
jgi:hypothetical protein